MKNIFYPNGFLLLQIEAFYKHVNDFIKYWKQKKLRVCYTFRLQ